MGRWSLVTPPTNEEAASTGAGAPIAPLDGLAATGMLEPTEGTDLAISVKLAPMSVREGEVDGLQSSGDQLRTRNS